MALLEFGRRRTGPLRSWFSRYLAILQSRVFLRYALLMFIMSFLLSALLVFRQPEYLREKSAHYFDYLWSASASHPIDELISEARAKHDNLMKEQSHHVAAAAQRYRQRRGRHPPPGFDDWVEYAIEHDAIIIESFFDRIYHDINPFWALDPYQTALRAASWHHVVRVRNGDAEGVGDVTGRVPWLRLWTDLVKEAAPFLPDVDMPINYMDESRLLVPWDNITEYVAIEKTRRLTAPREKVVRTYTGLRKIDAVVNDTKPYDPEWLTGGPYWEWTRMTCAPDSPSRNMTALEDFSHPPTFPEPWNPDWSYKGYVRNSTASTDPCLQPHLRGLHGTFIEPVSESTSKELIPMFGGSKLPNNNEILIPGAMYLTDDPFYSGGETHGAPWEDKLNGTVWRGVASGGRNKKENWTHFQRHRLVQMLNGTTVSEMEQTNERAATFPMPPLAQYDFPRRREGTIGTWLQGFADAGFVELLCFPKEVNCSYISHDMHEVASIPMGDQYMVKFLPDVDGNSFSARYRGFLLSTSLPIKSTVYAEWHDDRLQPWLHFVPMDNTYQDLYGILDYFTRDNKGDDSARFIATQGREWAAKVLRREDMLLYVWRLLLEFARVCDENREYLGYVDDLDLFG